MTRAAIRFAMIVLVVASVSCTGTGLSSPGAELATGQALLDLNDAIVQLREDNAMIQFQVDSLGEVVARQDSLLRQVAALSGVSVPAAR